MQYPNIGITYLDTVYVAKSLRILFHLREHVRPEIQERSEKG